MNVQCDSKVAAQLRDFAPVGSFICNSEVQYLTHISSLRKTTVGSNVRHPRCVLYNSMQLGMLTLTVEHNYIYFYYKEFTTATCFGPICGPSSGCGCKLLVIKTNIVVFDVKC